VANAGAARGRTRAAGPGGETARRQSRVAANGAEAANRGRDRGVRDRGRAGCYRSAVGAGLPAELADVGAHVVSVIEGVALYCLLAVVSALGGVGLLRLARIQLSDAARLYLGPTVILGLWSVMLGIGLGFAIPLDRFFWVCWLALLGLAGYGFYRERSTLIRVVRGAWLPLLLALAIPAAITAPYLWWGLTQYVGSPIMDGWSYVADGQYLWAYPRGADGGLAPLYQYAAHLSHTRYIGPGLLGLLSVAVGQPGNTQAAVGLLLVWLLFALATAGLFMASTYQLTRTGQVVFVVIAAASGWLVDILTANNFDNAVALPFVPALVGLARLAPRPRVGLVAMVGMLGAGVLYAYPEMAFLVLGLAVLAALQEAVRERSAPVWLLASLGLAVVLLGPYLGDFLPFFTSQLASSGTTVGERPGEGLFHELLARDQLLWAAWGLAGPVRTLGGLANLARLLLGLTLTCSAVVGVWLLVKRREIATVASLVLLAIGYGTLLMRYAYPYGAYKILTTGWPLVAVCLVLGLERIGCWLSRRQAWIRPELASGVAAVLLLAVVGLRVSAYDGDNPIKTYRSYGDELQQIRGIVGGQPVQLAVRNAQPNAWAVYYLRDANASLDLYTGYMEQSHVVPFMERARALEPAPTEYVLADGDATFVGNGLQLVSAGGPYTLWTTPPDPWAVVARIDTPNGVDYPGGVPSFRLGGDTASIYLLAGQPGWVCLSAELSPGSDAQPNQAVSVSVAGAPTQQVAVDGDAAEHFSVPVGAGAATVLLADPSAPTQLQASTSGSPAPTLVLVQAPSVAPGRCS
jgi:hypothetical protein